MRSDLEQWREPQALIYRDLTLYDASMGEWARDPELPIETGPVVGTSGERTRTSR